MGRGQRGHHHDAVASTDVPDSEDRRAYEHAAMLLRGADGPTERSAREIVARVTFLVEDERDDLLHAAEAERAVDPSGRAALAALERAQVLADRAGRGATSLALIEAGSRGASAYLLEESEEVAADLGMIAVRAATAALVSDLISQQDAELLTAPWRAVFGADDRRSAGPSAGR